MTDVRALVKQALLEMDPNLSELDGKWGYAAFIVASMILGPDPQAIADAMAFDSIFVGGCAERAREQGIWKPDQNPAEAYEGEDNGIKFWLDVSVLSGALKRVGGDKYQMTDAGRIEAEKLVKSSPEARDLMKRLKATSKKKRK